MARAWSHWWFANAVARDCTMYIEVVPSLVKVMVGIATPGPDEGADGAEGVDGVATGPRGFVLEHIGRGWCSGLLIQLATSTEAYFGLMA